MRVAVHPFLSLTSGGRREPTALFLVRLPAGRSKSPGSDGAGAVLWSNSVFGGQSNILSPKIGVRLQSPSHSTFVILKWPCPEGPLVSVSVSELEFAQPL